MTSKYRNQNSAKAHPQPVQEEATVVAMHAELAQETQAAAMQELMGWMAHHMRNPLASIQAACRSLHTELEGCDDHQQRLELTLGAVDRMLRVISTQVGNFANARPPQQQMDVDVGEHAAEIVTMFSIAYPQVGEISLAGGHNLRCRTAPLDLRVALFSLLSYAVKVSAGKPIRLVIEDAATQGILGKLADNPSASAYQVDSAAPSDGIGLLVAERFAKNVGGKIAVWIAEDGVKEFRLGLPQCGD